MTTIVTKTPKVTPPSDETFDTLSPFSFPAPVAPPKPKPTEPAPTPKEPAPTPQPVRPAPLKPAPVEPMKPVRRPAKPEETPCPHPDPDTGFPTCEITLPKIPF